MSPRIFLSYRREDAGPWAELIYTHLEPRIGADNLFWDVDSIPPGHDFREVIGAYLDRVDVLFVLIGRQWMKIGRTRLFQETDYVRFEIRYALEQNKLVVPVLLDHAAVPESKNLPEDIRPLVFKNAFPIQPGQVKRDCELLHGRILKWYEGQKAQPLGPVIQPEIREKPTSSPSAPDKQTGSFTDPRDGRVYRTIWLNGRMWMAQNLNFDVGEGCWFYDNDPKNGEKYGRLYTWEAAKRACPPGWRLPTWEEWDSLSTHFGGGLEAYKALISGGISGFDAVLAGERNSNGEFLYLRWYSYYWSSTEGGANNAWTYWLYSDNLALSRDYYCSKIVGLSLRCLKDD